MRILPMVTTACAVVSLMFPCSLMAQDNIDSTALLGNWLCEDSNEVATLKSQKFYGPAGHAVTDFLMQNQLVDSKMGVMGIGTWHLEGAVLVERGKEYEFYRLSLGGENLLGSILEIALTVEMLGQTSRSEIKELNDARMVISPQGGNREMVCLRNNL